MTNPKHIFFDMDNTLTRSKSVIAKPMAMALRTLLDSCDVVVVSGQTHEYIFKQIGSEFEQQVFVLAQNGNLATAPGGVRLWYQPIPWRGKLAILSHIARIKDSGVLDGLDIVEDDTVEDRGEQISYSIIGHHVNQDTKDAFDPDSKFRNKLLEQFPFQFEGANVVIGGTTTFDYIGKNKGANVQKLLEQKSWNADDCLYVGDKLEPGGNDSSVVGVCPTHAVANPEDTLALVQQLIASTVRQS